MVYILGWSIAYLAWLLWEVRVFRHKLVYFLPMVYFLAVIVLRYSGTDTHSYENIFRALIEGDSGTFISGLEPGFVLMARLVLSISPSEVEGVRVIGAIFVCLLWLYLLRADSVEFRFFALYFLPLHIYQYGMNAVRVGLASAMLMLAWQALRRGDLRLFLLVGGAGVCIHYSLAVPFLLLIIYEYRRFDLRTVVISSVLVTVFAVLVIARSDYFLGKLDTYVTASSPSTFSGVSQTILITWVLIVFATSPLGFMGKTKVLVGVVIFAAAFQALAFFSYAGIRFQDILKFVLPMLLIREFDRHSTCPPRLFWFGLFIAGLAGTVFAYRNFLADFDGQLTGSSTPFLPYRTVLDYNR